MVNIIEQVGGSIDTIGWASIGNIAFVLTIILLVISLFGMVWFLLWWKSYYINVKIYEPYGQISKENLEKLQKADGRKSAMKEIKFDMLKYRKTHGKYITQKGTTMFATFMPFKRHEPISMEYMFDDGVHLMRLSKDIYIPIEKPKVIVGIGENVTISVADNNKWVAWNNIMAERVNNKFQDQDAVKRATFYFVVGIVAIVLISAFVLWLIYSSTNKAYGAADKLSNLANALSGGGKAPV